MATAELGGPRLCCLSGVAPILSGAFMRRPIDPRFALSIGGVLCIAVVPLFVQTAGGVLEGRAARGDWRPTARACAVIFLRVSCRRRSPRNPSLGMTIYDGAQFPAEYRGSVFAAEHGSWNRSKRTGYKIIRVIMKDGAPTRDYEDFATGFVTTTRRCGGGRSV